MDTPVVYTSLIVVIIVLIPIYLYTARQSKKRRILNEKLEASLEDETIFDPQTGKKYSQQEIDDELTGTWTINDYYDKKNFYCFWNMEHEKKT